MVYINTLIGGSITIGSGGSSLPTAPNGKVLYKTSADGDWLESDAYMEDSVFYGFEEKENAVAVIIPSKDASGNVVTSIGNNAFDDCRSLISVTIPNSMMSIGFEAFRNCRGLASVTIPDSMTSIGSSAFSDCSGLISVTIGNGVTSIRDEAFYMCSSITNITIPDSVTSIGFTAFDGCTGLTSVTFEGKNKSTVQGMSNYPFGLNHASENGVTIHCSDGDIPLSYEN